MARLSAFDHSKEKTTMKRSTAAPKGKRWMEDGDDAHFTSSKKGKSKRTAGKRSKGRKSAQR